MNNIKPYKAPLIWRYRCDPKGWSFRIRYFALCYFASPVWAKKNSGKHLSVEIYHRTFRFWDTKND